MSTPQTGTPASPAAQDDQDRKKRELLAMLLSRKQAAAARESAIARRAPELDSEGRRIAPASYAQQRLWFLEQLEPGSARYNMTTAVRLEGRLDAAMLEAAIQAAILRHESLRTVFRHNGDRLEQIVLPISPFRLQTATIGAEGIDAAVSALLRRQASQPFDIARGPLLRAELLRIDAQTRVLVLAQHHIVSDGWSLGVLTGEIAALYDAFVAQADSGDEAARKRDPLPALPIQYIDFTLWQREWLTEERLAQQAEFWRGQLAGAPTSLELPTDFQRPAVQRGRGGKHAFAVPKAVAEALDSLSQRHGATLFMSLMAGLMLVLRRYSGQDDICVGTAVANRTRQELESLIGFFVNSLVLRAQLSDELDFAALLERVKTAATDAYTHQDLPFEQLVQELRPERDLSRAPLFQVMFGFDNTPRIDRNLGDLRVSRLDTDARAARFDLDLQMVKNDGGLHGAIEYDADLFRPDTIAGLAQQYVRVLEAVAAAPQRPIGELDLRDPAESAAILAGAAPVREYPRERDLATLFESAAAAAPEAVAIVDQDGAMSYAELEAQANRLAHWLVGQGVSPGDRIGLCIGRDRRLPAMMLAALKAGAVYVPLDANYPSSRLRFMLDDVAARLVVADAAHLDVLPEGAWRIVETAEAAAEAASCSDRPLRLSIDAGAVSHIMYTSGSTGKPKGMGMPHRIASRLVLSSDYVQLSASDRIAQVASVSFDAATFEIWGALLNGGRIVFIPRQVALEPLALAAALREQGVTVMFLTTALFNQMAQTVPDAFAAMNSVLFGGERVNPDAVRRVLASRPPQRLLHVYGPTENGVFSTWYRIAQVADNAQTIPIGKPIANSRAYILDAGRRLCPPGVPGEIYVGGDGLAVGYIGRDDLTAERFVEVELDGESVRLYRTGDLARYLPGGDIEFVGRIDNQVKIRGFRIEPGEIEAHAKRHPAVRDVVVAPRPGPAGLQLVAYVVPQDSADDITAALQAEHDANEGATSQTEAVLADSAIDLANGRSADLDDDESADQAIDQVRDWHALYHDTYATLAQNDDPRLSFTGWNSSYTGGPIDPNEMREWAENASGRILALQPKRILEIGCGSGLLLFRIAPQTERYRAVDFSESALDYVRSKLHVIGEHADKVSLHQGLADEIDQCEERGFDTVILNSIVQYFPRAQYLADVIRDVLPLLAPGGRIFLGDLRNHNLRRMFAASIERVRADDAVPVEELRRRTTQRLLHDGELLVAPEFFHLLRRRLLGIGRIEVMPKYAADENELTKYRYDVVLHLADATDATDAVEASADIRWLDWDAERLSLDAVETILATGPHALALAHVPNAKLAEDRAALLALDAQTAGEHNDAPTDAAALRAHAAGAPLPANFAAFQALAARHGYRLAVSWARCGEHGAFDLYFDRGGAPAPFPAPQVLDGPLERYTNLPLRNRLYAQLIPSLKAALANALPDYMVPSAYVLMDAIPLNANGKTDLAALPAPEGGVPEGRAYVAPRTEWERIVAGVWRDVLGIERIGIEDNFFALGGHSLMATQVMSRLQKRLELPSDLAYTRFGVRALFEAPTLAQLARVAEQVANEYRVFVADDTGAAEDVGETEEFVL